MDVIANSLAVLRRFTELLPNTAEIRTEPWAQGRSYRGAFSMVYLAKLMLSLCHKLEERRSIE